MLTEWLQGQLQYIAVGRRVRVYYITKLIMLLKDAKHDLGAYVYTTKDITSFARIFVCCQCVTQQLRARDTPT